MKMTVFCHIKPLEHNHKKNLFKQESEIWEFEPQETEKFAMQLTGMVWLG